jgi:chaperone modulatory protein CbpM
MEQEPRLIPASTCCTHYNIEYTFIESLREAGLIEVQMVEAQSFVPESQLSDLEQYTRLHHDLGINPAGIEAIAHLLRRVRSLQEELTGLRQRLNIYEGGDHFNH